MSDRQWWRTACDSSTVSWPVVPADPVDPARFQRARNSNVDHRMACPLSMYHNWPDVQYIPMWLLLSTGYPLLDFTRPDQRYIPHSIYAYNFIVFRLQLAIHSFSYPVTNHCSEQPGNCNNYCRAPQCKWKRKRMNIFLGVYSTYYQQTYIM